MREEAREPVLELSPTTPSCRPGCWRCRRRERLLPLKVPGLKPGIRGGGDGGHPRKKEVQPGQPGGGDWEVEQPRDSMFPAVKVASGRPGPTTFSASRL